MLTGVCAAWPEYFNIDPSIVRIIVWQQAMRGSIGLWPIIIASFVLPKKSEIYPGY
jgi:phage shock protein PspC (stress-responsive transcriptional regulator)